MFLFGGLGCVGVLPIDPFCDHPSHILKHLEVKFAELCLLVDPQKSGQVIRELNFAFTVLTRFHSRLIEHDARVLFVNSIV